MTTKGVSERRPEHALSPLIGRAPILATLSAERAVVLRGEAGAGKSRLLAEARAVTNGVMSASVRVHRGIAAPYEPIESLVAALQRRSGSKATALSRGGDERDRFVALRETLETLAARTPLLLQIDDVHRASPATLDAIAYCVDRTEDSPIRWQFASRPGSEVDRVWSDAARDGVLRFVDVPPLDEAQTRELAEAIAGAVPDHLYRATGGNPLYIEFVAASGRNADTGGLRAQLENRLRELPSEPARLAAAIAVARRPLGLAALLRTSEPGSSDLVRPALAALETAAIVRAGPDGYDFAHDLLRDACGGLLSASQRRELHASLEPLSITVTERAEHLLGAGQPEAARDVFLTSARAALDDYAFPEASQLLHRMTEARLVPAYATWETHALAAVTSAFDAGGSPPFPPALARREGVDPAIAIAYLRAFLRTTGRPEYPGGVDAVASVLGDPAMATLDRTAFRAFHARAHLNTHRFVEGLAASAPEPGDRSDSPGGFELRALHALFHGLVHDVADGRERLMTLAMDSAARALPTFAAVFEALATLEQTIDNSRGELFWAKIGIEWAGGTMNARRLFEFWTYGAMNAGLPREAAEATATAQAFYTRRGLRVPAAIVGGRAEAAAWAGDAAAAERELEELDLSLLNRHERAKISLDRGMLAEFRGDLRLAYSCYLHVVDKSVQLGALSSVGLVFLTRVAALLGDRALAEAHADECLAFASSVGPYAEACLFYASLAGDDVPAMRARCETALAAGLPYLERALALGHFGERARDRSALARAIVMFDAAGDSRHAERFREVARGFGFRPGSAHAVKPLLSPREREIVRHVAEGSTNREIAAKLHVSPKTVAACVSAVLEKCGMTSRVDIATRFASGRSFERGDFG